MMHHPGLHGTQDLSAGTGPWRHGLVMSYNFPDMLGNSCMYFDAASYSASTCTVEGYVLVFGLCIRI